MRNSCAALAQLSPQAVTMYRLPRLGGALGVWMPYATHGGPVVAHVVEVSGGICGMLPCAIPANTSTAVIASPIAIFFTL